MTELTDRDRRRLWWAKRIAATLGVLIVVIFAITSVLGYVYCTSERPAKETLFGMDAGVVDSE